MMIELNQTVKFVRQIKNKRMEKESPKKQIFQTQPHPNLPPYERFLKEVTTYTHNLNSHLTNAFNDQDKSIRRKRQELQKQLQDLRQKHYNQRQRIREMEEYFVRNCQNVIKNDIAKWEQHQLFFSRMCQNYQYEIEIQTMINARNRQKITLLKEELKQEMIQNRQSAVSQRLQLIHISKTNNFRSKKSISTKSHTKINRIKTEASQPTQITEFNEVTFRKNLKRHTQMDQMQTNLLCNVSQKMARVKTQISLPSLKKSQFIDAERIRNDDFNFMKPIGTIKKGSNKDSILPQMIKFFNEHHQKVQRRQIGVDWFQKVVFNNRNFEKIIEHLKGELELVSGKKKAGEGSNRVKDLVAKNLFRLKTQSTVNTNQSLVSQKSRSILHCSHKKPVSERLIG